MEFHPLPRASATRSFTEHTVIEVICLKTILDSLMGFFWPHDAVCGILVPQPGIEPLSSALEVRSL